MPCNDGSPFPSSCDCKAAVSAAKKRWLHNSPIAELLCTVLKQVDKLPHPVRSSIRLSDLPIEVQQWWREHQRRDALKEAADKKALKEAEKKTKDRIEREALLSKLSSRERKLLGHK